MTSPDSELMTTIEIARTYFVTRNAVANWKRRGKIVSRGKRGQYDLYHPDDVHRAATTRRPQTRGLRGRYTPLPAETSTPHA